MKQTPSTIEQFAVTQARDLAIRVVEVFHKGSDEEKSEARTAIRTMCSEMFNEGVKNDEQVRQLLQLSLDGLNHGTWPQPIEPRGQGAGTLAGARKPLPH